jgi:hypothetical protein
MTRITLCGLFTLPLLVWQLQSAHAKVIPLFSTGTDSSGNLLPGGSADPHYDVTGPGVPGGGPAAVYSPSSLWFQWAPNDPHSGWIGFQDSFSSSPHGDYTYVQTFDLTGYDPSTASLSGLWAADQFGSIDLNGSPTGISVPDGNWNAGSFPNLNPFTITSGFQSGLNTLAFIVTEPDDGDGLRVSNLSLTESAVPEPSTAVLLTLGCVVVLVIARRSHAEAI